MKDVIDFEIHDTLNPKLWDGENLKADVRKKLLEIANAFHKYMNIDAKLKDVIITGSSSNYNYSPKFSDIDLHLLYDFSEVLSEDEDTITTHEDLVQGYMLAKKSQWNDAFDIKVNGVEVEVYSQDVDEPHEANGQYSIIKNDWNKKPTKENPELDKVSAEKKADLLSKLIDKAISSNVSFESLEKIQEKIWKMRKAGLDTDSGEFSTENLAFKVLRRDGSIEALLNQMDKKFEEDLSL